MVSPVRAHVYFHYALDLWTRWWRKHHARGKLILVRYADNYGVGFQYRQEAERYLEELKQRLAKFGLALHAKKTRLIEFDRFAAANRRRRGQGKPETFDFLGMTHYGTVTRRGKFRLGRKPIRKRVARTLRRIRDTLRTRWHVDRHEHALWLGRVIRGWLNYYAVSGSSRFLSALVPQVKRLLLRALRRRSPRDRTSWETVDRLAKRYWPPVRILHLQTADRMR